MKSILALASCAALVLISSCGKGDKAPGGGSSGSADAGKAGGNGPAADQAPVDVPPKGPASPEEAARTLDLNTMPVMEAVVLKDTVPMCSHTIANFSCQVKGSVKDVYEFYRKQLASQRWKLDADSSSIMDQAASATFARNTFHVSLTVMPQGGPGEVNVAIHNHGNVNLAKLPRPPVIKTTYEGPITAMYLTDAPVGATADACRKLLTEAGWITYGSAGDTVYYKQKGIHLTVTVSSAPAEGGKTMINFFGEQMSADIPALPEAQDIRYVDDLRRLSFETAVPRKSVAEAYQQLLAKDGWKSTTENLITDDAKSFMIFREPGGGMLSLDMKERGNNRDVSLTYMTFAEYKEMEKKADERREAAKLKQAEKNK